MKKVLATLAMVAFASTSFAAVTIDEDGIGFVGKGDVQEIYNWNNSDLQSNHALVQFRLGTPGVYSWTCLHPVHGEKNAKQETKKVNSNLAIDTRKNKNGQVTGFNLNGFGESETLVVGQCENKWTLKQDSIKFTGPEDESNVLQVSIDGTEWHDLN